MAKSKNKLTSKLKRASNLISRSTKRMKILIRRKTKAWNIQEKVMRNLTPLNKQSKKMLCPKKQCRTPSLRPKLKKTQRILPHQHYKRMSQSAILSLLTVLRNPSRSFNVRSKPRMMPLTKWYNPSSRRARPSYLRTMRFSLLRKTSNQEEASCAQ